EAGSTVQGPDWQMAPTNPAFDQARRAAAEDARHRAESYAEALGLQVGPVAWVAEPGMRDGGGAPLAASRIEPSSVAGPEARGSHPGEPSEDLTPAEMTVEATVEVGFRIL